MKPLAIDSHHHVWRYSAEEYPWISDTMGVLRQDFLGPELKETIAPHRFIGTVAVQARQSIEETDWLIQLALSVPEILGVVGWAPLQQDIHRLLPLLETWSVYPKLKGFRHVVQDEPDDNFLLGADFNRGVAQLANYHWTYDLLVFPNQLPAAIAFVDRHPNQKFVLDHMGKPRLSSNTFDKEWEENFRELSKRPHVACKFSGLATEVRDPTWDTDLLHRYWDCALDTFGIKRLMFGSDWPVCLLRTTYARWVQSIDKLACSLSEVEKELFWHSNAVEFYRLVGPDSLN